QMAAPKSRRSWPFPSITGGTGAAASVAPQHNETTSASRIAPGRNRLAAGTEPVMGSAGDLLHMTNLLHVVASSLMCAEVSALVHSSAKSIFPNQISSATGTRGRLAA